MSSLVKGIGRSLTCAGALAGSLMAVLAAPVAAYAEAAKPAPGPVAWGLTSGAKHCVIFKESRRTTGAFFIVAATFKTVAKLTVLESDDFKLDPPTYIEDLPTMNALQERAISERLRFVKIPDTYTPDLLQAARDLCRKPDLLPPEPSTPTDAGLKDGQTPDGATPRGTNK